jgi:hypothetical protein
MNLRSPGASRGEIGPETALSIPEVPRRNQTLLHPDTRLQYIDDTIGYGVFATRPIPRGTVTWVRDPLDQEWEERLTLDGGRWQELFEKYSYITPRGTRLLCWDFTRYMNHSCEASCFLVGEDMEIAIRDIPVGAQLTSDYATLNVEQDFECLCAQPGCRGTVGSHDVFELADTWDQAIRAAVALGSAVEQPLREWHRDWDSVVLRMRDPAQIPSIRSMVWAPTAASASRLHAEANRFRGRASGRR